MVSLTPKIIIGFYLLLLAVGILQVNAQVACSAGNPCPQSSPCCSEFGYCGTGRFCLGGCNPLLSYNATSCAPNPVCVSQNYTLKSSSFIDSSDYNGESTYDFTTDGQPIYSTSNGGNEVILTMAKNTQGTRISTVRYVWYGTITARLKTSRTQGVVTAFITMSNVKDEVDWEWVGANLNQGQSNYFYRGIVDYGNSAVHPVSGGDTFSNFHEYTIDWQPDTLTWYIDGKAVRVLNKKDTFNTTTKQYSYPSTPSRVQMSIWNGGAGPEGTKAWAGGATNWNTADVQNPGYYYVQVAGLSIQCAQAAPNNATAYIYDSNAGVSYTNAPTTVKVSTPQSEGLPQGAGNNNVNSLPNITGQYVADVTSSSSKEIFSTTTLTVAILTCLLRNLF